MYGELGSRHLYFNVPENFSGSRRPKKKDLETLQKLENEKDRIAFVQAQKTLVEGPRGFALAVDYIFHARGEASQQRYADVRDAIKTKRVLTAKAKSRLRITPSPAVNRPTESPSQEILNSCKISEAHRKYTLVTRWNNSSFYTAEENENYATFMSASIEETASRLQSGKLTDFEQLFEHSAKQRLQVDLEKLSARNLKKFQVTKDDLEDITLSEAKERIQKLLKTIGAYTLFEYPHMYKFLHFLDGATRPEGTSGCRGAVTNMEGRYTYIGEEIIALLKRYQGDSEAAKKDGYAIKFRPSNDKSKLISISNNPNTDFKKFENLKKVSPSETAFHGRIDIDEPQWAYLPFGETMVSCPKLEVAYVPDHRQKAQELFFKYDVGQKELGQQALTENALTAYWYSINTVLLLRGSAAIAEHMLRSVLLAHGIELQPVQVGKSLDLEANLHPCEIFVKKAMAELVPMYHPLRAEGMSA